MTKRSPNFARVLAPSDPKAAGYRAPGAGDDGGPLHGDEIDAVIELGFLMANADGRASLDELESFRALLRHLKPDTKLAGVLDQLSEQLDKAESIEERVRVVAKSLTRPSARELAYKAVHTIAIFDLETNEAERDLDELMIEVLGLSDRVDELESEVNEALMT
jgi:uncharacterized tellurite resistance protein B-like protein